MSSTFISALIYEIYTHPVSKASFLNIAITPDKVIRPFVSQQDCLPLPEVHILCNIIYKIEPESELESRQMMLKRAIQDTAKKFDDALYMSIPESEKRGVIGKMVWGRFRHYQKEWRTNFYNWKHKIPNKIYDRTPITAPVRSPVLIEPFTL